MPAALTDFLLHWGIMSLSLWVASYIFKGMAFETTPSLAISALVLGFANAVVRPLLLVLTFPLTVFTLGFFWLVINALMVMLTARMVKGFRLDGFWTAFFVAIFIALFSMFVETMLPHEKPILIDTSRSIEI